MDTKVEDYKLKPLSKFFRPYFSPSFNSYEMDYAISNFLINNEKIYKYYLILININTQFLFAVPIKNNITPSIEISRIIIENINDHLKLISPTLKINNIRADGDSKFGKIIEDKDGPKAVKLGRMIYKRNSFLEYLESENITLYLTLLLS
jgi:hypothetical protein